MIQQRPQDISSRILKAIRDAIERLGRNTNTPINVRCTAITIPANCSMLKKRATLEVARAAGLENAHLVTDPVAGSVSDHLHS